MAETTQFRLMCAFYGVLCAAVTLFLAGPFMWGGVDFENMSLAIRIGAVASALLAIWFFAVGLFAEPKIVETVGSLGLAQDAILLVLPYMVFVGTRSVYRSLRGSRGAGGKP